ncbi:MAG: FxLYD domain-containing protein [Candidatus Methylomirabilales bacterium]
MVGGPAAAATKRGDVVVLDHDRWLDTLRGTVKNFSTRPARDVTVVVRFLDTKRKVLGTQRVSVGDLKSGDQARFDFSIEERNRAAASYDFTVHAIWPRQ